MSQITTRRMPHTNRLFDGSSHSWRRARTRFWTRNPGSCARNQRAVDEPDLALSDQFGDHHLDRGDLWRQAAQPAVVLGLIGQVRKEARKQFADRAKNWRSLLSP